MSIYSYNILEKEMATHSSILVWEIPWTEGPGGPQLTWSQRIGHDLATKPPPQGQEQESEFRHQMGTQLPNLC